MKKTVQIISFLLLCVYIVAVGFLCLMEPEDMPALPVDLFGIPLDKVAHFTMFFPWPILSWFSFNHEGKSWKWKSVLLLMILLTGSVIAISTEFLQKMTGYRTFDLHDFYADLAGMGLCWCAIAVSAYIEAKKGKRTCSRKQS